MNHQHNRIYGIMHEGHQLFWKYYTNKNNANIYLNKYLDFVFVFASHGYFM